MSEKLRIFETETEARAQIAELAAVSFSVLHLGTDTYGIIAESGERVLMVCEDGQLRPYKKRRDRHAVDRAYVICGNCAHFKPPIHQKNTGRCLKLRDRMHASEKRNCEEFELQAD